MKLRRSRRRASRRAAEKRLGFGALGGLYLLAVILAAFAADLVREVGSITVRALHGLHGVKAVGAGKSSKVATGAGLSLLGYCHSGGTLC